MVCHQVSASGLRRVGTTGGARLSSSLLSVSDQPGLWHWSTVSHSSTDAPVTEAPYSNAREVSANSNSAYFGFLQLTKVDTGQHIAQCSAYQRRRSSRCFTSPFVVGAPRVELLRYQSPAEGASSGDSSPHLALPKSGKSAPLAHAMFESAHSDCHCDCRLNAKETPMNVI